MSSNLSRRDFLRIATGSIISFPGVAAATMVSVPNAALAEAVDENGWAIEDKENENPEELFTNQIELIPLTLSEVAFVICDVSMPYDSANPNKNRVAGAQIKIVSRDTGKSVAGTTREDGSVLFDIAPLCKLGKGETVETCKHFTFIGTVLIKASGYRSFYTTLMIIDGMQTHVVPTRKMEMGWPYPVSASLDGWDVLYTDNTPAYSPSNDIQHDLAVTIQNVTPDEEIEMSLVEMVDGKPGTVLHSMDDFPTGKNFSGSFRYRFMQQGHADAFKIGKKYGIVLKQGSKAWSFPLQINCKATPIPEPGRLISPQDCKPLGDPAPRGPQVDAKMTKLFPIGGGDSLWSWIPNLGPFQFVIDPCGSFTVSLTLLQLDYSWSKSTDWQADPVEPAESERVSNSANSDISNLLEDDNSLLAASEDEGGDLAAQANSNADDSNEGDGSSILDDGSQRSGSSAGGDVAGGPIEHDAKVEGWKRTPNKSISDQWEKQKENIARGKSNYAAAKADKAANPDRPGNTTIELSKTFKMNFKASVFGVLSWSSAGAASGEDPGWSGHAGLAFVFTANYAFCNNFLAGPIPVLFQWGFRFTFSTKITAGIVCKDPDTKRAEKIEKGQAVVPAKEVIGNLDYYNFDYTNTGIGITLTFWPWISIGVGVKGVASVSVRGSLTLTIYLGVPFTKTGLTSKHAGIPDKPSPHIIMGASAELTLVFELFFFTKNISVAKLSNNNMYNNWNDPSWRIDKAEYWTLGSKKLSELSEQADELDPSFIMDCMADEEADLWGDDAAIDAKLNGEKFDEMIQDMQPLDSWMAESYEASLNSLSAQAEEEIPVPVLNATYVEDASVTDDGFVIPAIIYSYQTQEEHEEQLKAQALEEQGNAQAQEQPVAEAVPAEEATATNVAGAVAPADANAAHLDTAAAADTTAATSGEAAGAADVEQVAPEAITEGADAQAAVVPMVVESAAATASATDVSPDAQASSNETPLDVQDEAVVTDSEIPDVQPTEVQNAEQPAAEQPANVAAATSEEVPAQTEDQAANDTSQASEEQPAPEPEERSVQDMAEEATEEPVLQAQSEEDFRARYPFGYQAPVYDMDWEPQLSGLEALADESPVVGLGDEGGLVFSDERDKRINPEGTSLFGSQRIQIVTIPEVFMRGPEGVNTVLALRLGVVNINGKPRTRVIATKIDGIRDVGMKRVLDFKFVSPTAGGQSGTDADLTQRLKQYNRDDLHDYEFAAAYYWEDGRVQIGASGLSIYLAVLSGRRDNVSSKSVAQAATDLVLSWVSIDVSCFLDARFANNPRVASQFSWPGDLVFGSDNMKHSISNLQISFDAKVEEKPKNNDGIVVLETAVISYLDRLGVTAEAAMSHKQDGGATVRIGMLFTTRWDASSTLTTRFFSVIQSPAAIENYIGSITDKSTYDLRFWRKLDDHYLFMVRGSSQSRFYVMQVKPGDPSAKEDKDIAPSIQAIRLVDTQDGSTQLHHWRDDTGGQHFLATRGGVTAQADGETSDGGVDRELCAVDFAGLDGASPSMSFEGVGPKDFSISSFGAYGDFIFWPGTKDGSPGVQAVDKENDDVELVDQNPVSRSWLVASRCRKDPATGQTKFSEPFYLADLKHKADNVVSVRGARGALDLVVCGLTDRMHGKANLYHTRIPFTRSITAMRASAETPYIVGGRPASFFITLRNDGNTFVGGCTIEMWESGAVAAKADLVFSADTLQESEHNPTQENTDKLKDVEPDFALVPGMCSVYKVTLPMPKEWVGGVNKDGTRITKKVCFRATTPLEKRADGSLVAQADEGESFEFSVHEANIPMEGIDVDVYTYDELSFVDAPVTMLDKDASPASTSSSKQELPRTDDPGRKLGLGGAMAAAAGAAVLAYERRRAANEAAEEESAGS